MDCGEYILAGYKLEIGHPREPLPLCFLQGLFRCLPRSQGWHLWLTGCRSLASGLTIMFLFWTITHLARKIIIPAGVEETLARTLAIMAAGITGSLAYAFFQIHLGFQQLKGEVYATSSLFTAITFWAILKWENEADKPYFRPLADTYILPGWIVDRGTPS
ncbi:MAG: DUF2723 domain-containing protein [Bacteroidales bacterium]